MDGIGRHATVAVEKHRGLGYENAGGSLRDKIDPRATNFRVTRYVFYVISLPIVSLNDWTPRGAGYYVGCLGIRCGQDRRQQDERSRADHCGGPPRPVPPDAVCSCVLPTAWLLLVSVPVVATLPLMLVVPLRLIVGAVSVI